MNDPEEAPERSERRRRGRWWELPVLIVIAIAAAVLVKTFVVQPFFIPSDSMERTLHGCPGCNGDRIVVDKPVYSLVRDPHPGDVIVFKAPSGWPSESPAAPPSNPLIRGVRSLGQLVGVTHPDEEDLVKRVIAIGGQTVRCCDVNGNVQLSNSGANGPWRSLDDGSYVFVDPGRADGAQIPFGPITVPDGRLWVMGDHRDDSLDSRYHCGAVPGPGTAVCANPTVAQASQATVPVSDVIGKAVLIAWPVSRWRTLGTPATFTGLPRPSAEGGWAGSAAVLSAGAVVLPVRLRRGRPRRRRRFGRRDQPGSDDRRF